MAAERATTPRPGGYGSRLVVIGCGNPFAGDDGAGAEFVRRLRDQGDCRCQVQILPQAGVELLDLVSDAEVVLLVDAVASGAPPGTLHLLPLPSNDIEARALSNVSSHGWGLVEVLELARTLGRPVPRLVVLGIEIGTASPSEHLSAPVAQGLELALARFGELRSLLLSQELQGSKGFQWCRVG